MAKWDACSKCSAAAQAVLFAPFRPEGTRAHAHCTASKATQTPPHAHTHPPAPAPKPQTPSQPQRAPKPAAPAPARCRSPRAPQGLGPPAAMQGGRLRGRCEKMGADGVRHWGRGGRGELGRQVTGRARNKGCGRQQTLWILDPPISHPSPRAVPLPHSRPTLQDPKPLHYQSHYSPHPSDTNHMHTSPATRPHAPAQRPTLKRPKPRKH